MEQRIENTQVMAPLMDVHQFLKTFGLKESVVRRALRAGRIPHMKVGNRYMIDTAAFMENVRRGDYCI